MNRKQRREYVKSLRKIGLSKSEAVDFIEKENSFEVGDKVKINYEQVNRRRDYFSPEYVEFVDKNKDQVFTLAKTPEYKTFYIFAETADKDSPFYMEKPWMWSFMDLIKVGDETD